MSNALNMTREVAALKRMTVKELRGRYLEVFGEATRSGNKDFLWKRQYEFRIALFPSSFRDGACATQTDDATESRHATDRAGSDATLSVSL